MTRVAKRNASRPPHKASRGAGDLQQFDARTATGPDATAIWDCVLPPQSLTPLAPPLAISRHMWQSHEVYGIGVVGGSPSKQVGARLEARIA